MNQQTPLKTSYFRGPLTPPLVDETIGSLFDRIAVKYADQEALVVRHQGIRWTYAQYRARVEELATGLLALGILPGERVAIWAPNCYEWCLTQFATAKIGAILVCINPAYRTYELEYALNKSGCRLLIAAEQFKSSQYLEMIRELAPELDGSSAGQLRSERLPQLEIVIRMGEEPTPGMYNFAEVCTLGSMEDYAGMSALQASQHAHDPINIQFTSGTTGSPKGATLTHHNILNNASMIAGGMRFTDQDCLCVPVPLYHCFGMVAGTLLCLTRGAKLVLPGEAFEPGAVLEAVQAERCTALHGVPTMFIAELEHPDFGSYDFSSLRTGLMAGAPCPVEVMKQVIEKMNMSELLIAYGQTECSPVNHMTLFDDSLQKRVETVGKPGPHLEVKMVDDQGRTVPVGERGDICTRGYAVMQGYWNDPEQSAATVDSDGWLHSGDIGIMDDQGYVQVVGRIKDMIIRGGENVYPREIEELLYTHPLIEEAQVIGVPDQKFGEEVCAWIKVKDGAGLSEDEIRAFCKERAAYFKVPRYIRLVDESPMTVTGKIQKYKMREHMVTEFAKQTAAINVEAS